MLKTVRAQSVVLCLLGASVTSGAVRWWWVAGAAAFFGSLLNDAEDMPSLWPLAMRAVRRRRHKRPTTVVLDLPEPTEFAVQPMTLPVASELQRIASTAIAGLQLSQGMGSPFGAAPTPADAEAQAEAQVAYMRVTYVQLAYLLTDMANGAHPSVDTLGAYLELHEARALIGRLGATE